MDRTGIVGRNGMATGTGNTHTQWIVVVVVATGMGFATVVARIGFVAVVLGQRPKGCIGRPPSVTARSKTTLCCTVLGRVQYGPGVSADFECLTAEFVS